MSEYIEREAAIQALCGACLARGNCGHTCKEVEVLQSIPAADVVPVGAYNQVAWERDTAIEQLKQIGKSFGEQMDDVRPVVLCRDCKHRDPEDHKCDCGQLERAGCVFPVDDDYFCAYGEKREES